METFSSKMSYFVNKTVRVVTTEKHEDSTVVVSGEVSEVGEDYLSIQTSEDEQQFINFAQVIRIFEA